MEQIKLEHSENETPMTATELEIINVAVKAVGKEYENNVVKVETILNEVLLEELARNDVEVGKV